MFKKIIRNKKGTAEIIGSVMFIIIVMFFFTNVYLWHDAATKQMNDLYVQKLNSPIVVYAYPTSPAFPNVVLNVTNVGGIDAQLSRSWVDVKSSSETGPDQLHQPFPLGNQVVAAGQSKNVTLEYRNPVRMTHFTVVTTVGNLASCDYDYSP